MSYNLNNKNAVIFALSFAAMMTAGRAALAEEAAPILDMPVLEQPEQDEAAPIKAEILDNQIAQAEQAVDAVEEQIAEVKEDTSFLDSVEETPAVLPLAEAPAPAEETQTPAEVAPTEGQALLQPVALPEEDDDEGEILDAPAPAAAADEATAEKAPEISPEAAPKSPFENFGNAILSKVDNDLFNQMSNIEKQTTILNLELKREELKSRVEALRAQRMRAREEIEERRRAEEEKVKEQEAKRQARILAEEQKLKEKEIELEKLRQGKIINEYMNEMLVMNQRWIEKNAALQKHIDQLVNERKELVKTLEKKTAELKKKSGEVHAKAEVASKVHQKTIETMSVKINQLQQSVIDGEKRLKKMKENDEAANPFAAASVPQTVKQDLSSEYAIMDITGQGDDIVAKIVNSEGSTFTVHRGSVLRGGEVVTAITERYIMFDHEGEKSYLYPGSSIMETEPEGGFGEGDVLPAGSKDNAPIAATVTVGPAAAPAPAPAAAPVQQTTQQPAKSKTTAKPLNSNTGNKMQSKKKTVSTSSHSGRRGSMSFASGMFVD